MSNARAVIESESARSFVRRRIDDIHHNVEYQSFMVGGGPGFAVILRAPQGRKINLGDVYGRPDGMWLAHSTRVRGDYHDGILKTRKNAAQALVAWYFVNGLPPWPIRIPE